jgi:primosomal protein N' (replication factor Y)
MPKWIDIAVSAPAHGQVGGLLTYASNSDLALGPLVRVPFGKREVLGVVWGVHDAAPKILRRIPSNTLQQP